MGAPWTPGPWYMKPGDSVVTIHQPDGRYVAATNTKAYWQRHDTTDVANARLIAAAPDLAEALEKLLAEHLDLAGRADCLEWAEAEPSPVIAARLALSKARGETA